VCSAARPIREELVDQHTGVLRGVDDGGEVLLALGIQPRAGVIAQQLGEPGDVPDRRAQVVRDRVRE
jgi:hypothetical protein